MQSFNALGDLVRTVHSRPLRTMLVLLLLLTAAPLAAQDTTQGEELFDQLGSWTGDLDQLLESQKLRALVVHNKMLYFLDRGRQRGSSYELLKALEKFINEKQNNKTLMTHIVFVPVTRDRLLPELLAGRGDIAVANLTVTPERRKLVDFSQPLLTGIKELLVTGPAAPDFDGLEGLSGQSVHVRRSSSYYEHLQALNGRFRKEGRAEIHIQVADELLEDADLLEMVNAGIIPMVIIDSHKAAFWSEVFDNIRVHPDIAINSGGEIAWAMRPDSPKLKALLDEFVAQHKKGTLLGNIIYKRYLKENKWARNNLSKAEIEKFNRVVEVFKTYAGRYQFDYLMVLALAYQESQLDQSKKSPAGAVGIMQLLPSTAADKNVGIPNIGGLENNVHAGVKYLRFLNDRYFSGEEIRPLDKMLLSFAAYNAGPAKIDRLRKEARKMGLDANVWFKNVEVVAAKRIGRETVQYVSNIFKYYLAYRMLSERAAARKGRGASFLDS